MEFAESEARAGRNPVSETSGPRVGHTVSVLYVIESFEDRLTVSALGIVLERRGIAKGTVCKMKTVLQALYDGKITSDQVTSLNAAYNLVTAKPVTVSINDYMAGLKSLSVVELEGLYVLIQHEIGERE